MKTKAFLLTTTLLLGATSALSAQTDLKQGFETPPAAAMPRVWWHWIDGNVSEAGAKRDLQWMSKIGIGGVQIFSGGGFAKPAVDQPVAFMSPEWKKVFVQSVDQATAAGMDVGIAGSPGWSETGGTWVAPEDAMKKYVWTTTQVEGGKPVSIVLPHPPGVSGPFQGVARVAARMPVGNPQYYADSYVIAFPTPAGETALPDAQFSSGSKQIDMTSALNTEKGAVKVPLDRETQSGDLDITFAKPTSLGAITVGTLERIDVEILSSTDGQTWAPLLKAAGSKADPVVSQQTFSFPPVTAQRFKVRFTLQPPGPLAAVASKPKPQNLTIVRFGLSGGARVNRFEAKAGFEPSADFTADNTGRVDPRFVIPKDKVLNLTSHLQADGRLDWTPPSGKWTVLRFGWSLTGQVNHPAEAAATGLEVDKLDPAAVQRYLDQYLSLYNDATGGKVGHQISELLTDSWEAGTQNWTPTLPAQFLARRGYDPIAFLPTLAGYVVQDADASDRFLWDYRQTLKDSLADNHYGVLKAELAKRSMLYYSEASGDDARILGDGFSIKARADIPTGEFWYRNFATVKGQPPLQADLMEAASVGHLYGKPYVAAESLTVAAFSDPWSFSPRMLRPVADKIFSLGVNRILYHESMQQPFEDKKPGLSLMIFGQYFNRNETWADQAGPWVTYLGRNAYMLQQGRYVADIAYYYGEEKNLTEQSLDHFDFKVPDGYHFDLINAEALSRAVDVKDGRLTSLGGTSYSVIYIAPYVTRYTLPTLERLKDLVTAGAVLVGPRPTSGLGLDSPDDKVLALASDLWGDGAVGNAGRAVGKGRVFSSDLATALQTLGVTPDNPIVAGAAGPDIVSLHRQTDDADIYFVSNQSKAAQTFDMAFRVDGRLPEFWHATSGKSSPAAYRRDSGRTIVPVNLQADESVFVVFQKPATAQSATIAPLADQPVATLDGSWQVAFEPGRGAPATATFEGLSDWTANPDPGIKYFSGAATYTKTIKVPRFRLQQGQCLSIDLGQVNELAEVSVNGKPIGTAWHAPYRLDASAALRPGKNTLAIKVVNLWPNRLIGDKQPGATKVTFAPGNVYTAKSDLMPSGLLGPVRIVQGDCPY